jgi:hypothetical protein
MSDLPPPPPGAPPPPPPGAPPPPPPPPSEPPLTSGGNCPNCGAPVRPDQDWCLNCGAAVTTEVAGAGGWRTPVAIVAAVLLVAAAALVFAFIELSGEADRVARAPVTPVTGPTGTATVTPTPTATPTTTMPGTTGPSGPTGFTTGPSGALSPTPTPAGGGIGKWPAGETAYTVILFSETSRSSAQSKAKTVSSLPNVGILNSSDFSSLRGGYWVVFSDQYDTIDEATKAAEDAASQAPGAYAKEVVPK